MSSGSSHIGDQTIGERSTAILEGGIDRVRGGLSGILQGGIPDVSTPVLDSGGLPYMDFVKQHWPALLLVAVIIYVVWHYKS
jgi:hypothetical protein